MVETATYQAARNSQYVEEWTDAIIEEYNNLIQNGTWVEISESEMPIGPKSDRWKTDIPAETRSKRRNHAIQGTLVLSFSSQQAVLDLVSLSTL